jgi:ankyrin repeat protein
MLSAVPNLFHRSLKRTILNFLSRWNCMLHACCSNNLDVVVAALDGGVDINWTKNRFAVTPLHAAIVNRHVDVFGLLIMRGADIFAVDTDGCSALQLAFFFSQCDAVRLLVVASLCPRDDRMRPISTIQECLDWELRRRTRTRP